MKKSAIQDMKNKSQEELQKLVAESRLKLRRLVFDREAGKVKNNHEIREVRREIARMLTFLKNQ